MGKYLNKAKRNKKKLALALITLIAVALYVRHVKIHGQSGGLSPKDFVARAKQDYNILKKLGGDVAGRVKKHVVSLYQGRGGVKVSSRRKSKRKSKGRKKNSRKRRFPSGFGSMGNTRGTRGW
jgi:hypothetical protein